MIFLNEIEKYIKRGSPYFIAYYGASTVSHEHIFPRWSEIIQYVLKDYFEEKLKEYKTPYWNIQSGNFGLNGATSTEIKKLLKSHVLLRKPQMIFLSMGKNDAYLEIDKKETMANLSSTIQSLLDEKIRVVMSTTIPSLRRDLNEKVEPYVEVEREVGLTFKKDPNFLFIDLFSLFPLGAIDKSYSLIEVEDNEDVGFLAGDIDPVHYNKYGNAFVAKILLKKAFNIDFDEDRFLKDIQNNTIKYPGY